MPIADNGHMRLDTNQSWATSAGLLDSYVRPSEPTSAEGASTICLAPGRAHGLKIPAMRVAKVMAPTTDMVCDFVGKEVCGMPLF
jgi:hypothetical protein